MEIALSRKKITLLIIGSFVFVATGCWLVSRSDITSHPILDSRPLTSFIGIAGILFFGFCGIYGLLKLRDKKPGLIIDESGITDNSSGLASGRILWSDLSQVSVLTIHRQKLIMLHVKNPDDYINRQPSAFKRKMMALNYKMYGTPLSITSNTLKIPFNELLKIIAENLEANRVIPARRS
jgi:hypothetical protein